MKLTSLYETVTAKIVAEMERGTVPWVRPWKNGKSVGVMPQNAATGRPYSGVNILLLWAARDAQGWPTAGFMTFQQALEKGGCVRKGEKGTHVIFTKPIAVREDDEDKTVRMARAYVVFNEAQIDRLPTPQETAEKPRHRPEHLNDAFVSAPGVPIRRGGNKAAYIPSQDFIALPEETLFETLEHSWATALHELVHASGHPSRLNRDLKNRFGSREYMAEELIAELGSAFLCAHLGITGELRHASYIAAWIALLKADQRAIFTAASKASQAADYLRAFSEPKQEAA